MQRAFSRFRPGFTLIELLVVIAIIAILAAILFPVFSRAKAAAKQTADLSNVRQIAVAFLMYTTDYDENYPVAFYERSASATPMSWPMYLLPYVKSTAIFRSPSDTRSTGIPPGSKFPVNYAYNYYVGGNNFAVFNATTSSMVKPAQTVLLSNAGTTAQLGVAPKDWPQKIHPTGQYTSWMLVHAGSTLIATANYGAPFGLHNGKANVVWADTHVGVRAIESFYTLPGHEVPGRPDGRATWWSPCLDPDFGCFD
ncbi:MAG: prepilin-type N-terminal cleavage/methylation domain-containing protein [Fimbriimonadaceae bacterium]